ncbi:MAG TPA: aldolase/citrate lyase family protein [Acidimicrobiales bacterium]|nr:aldolase/citrate lyase family protein [Acidimicrobiales bacterium]
MTDDGAAGPSSPAAFADRVRAGEPVVGTFLKLAGLEATDLVAGAGFDFAVVDVEHSQLDPAEVQRLVRHAAAVGLPPVVRIPAVDAGLVNRLLEAGAAGVQVSSVRTVAQAEALRAAMRYAPEGIRSVSAAQPAAGYGARPLADYLADVRRSPPLVVGQIETATTDDPLDEIVAVLDVAFIGTTDLSVDLGVPGRMDHPAVRERIGQVAAAAVRHRVALGGWAPGTAAAEALREGGASYLVVGSDLQALQQGLTAMAARPSAAAAPGTPAPAGGGAA